jgi:hypothetical protein
MKKQSNWIYVVPVCIGIISLLLIVYFVVCSNNTSKCSIKEKFTSLKKCAFVIPLHPKHYNHGHTIAKELAQSDADLYFVFSTEEDKNDFFKNADSGIHAQHLILTDFTNLEIVQSTHSFVSIKKLYAVSQLYEKYDYISCIDSEIMFLKKNGFYDMMRSICEAKTICGGTLHEGSGDINILRDSLTKLTDDIYHEDLRKLSNDFRTYTWWTNLPVYDCKHVADFLKWIDFKNTNLHRFSWNVFDDMLYNFYCILMHNYTLKEIENHNHSLEFANHDIVEYVDTKLCKLYWVNNNAYRQNKEYYEQNGFYIVFHLDRWE